MSFESGPQPFPRNVADRRMQLQLVDEFLEEHRRHPAVRVIQDFMQYMRAGKNPTDVYLPPGQRDALNMAYRDDCIRQFASRQLAAVPKHKRAQVLLEELRFYEARIDAQYRLQDESAVEGHYRWLFRAKRAVRRSFPSTTRRLRDILRTTVEVEPGQS